MTDDRDTLTARETECLALYSELWSYRAVAERLGLSVNTVAKHLSNARAKLDTRKTAEAIAARPRSNQF